MKDIGTRSIIMVVSLGSAVPCNLFGPQFSSSVKQGKEGCLQQS
jgi:hypothetical protein